MDYEDIVDIIMKTLCVLGISNRHNIHNLKNRQNCTSAVAQVNVMHIKYLNAQPVRSRLCQIRLPTCLPAPQRCWGPLGRSEQAVFLGPDFWWISVNGSLAPVTASARITQTGSNVALWFYVLHCARDARLCWNQANILWFMVRQKWRPKPIFPLIINWDPFEG